MEPTNYLEEENIQTDDKLLEDAIMKLEADHESKVTDEIRDQTVYTVDSDFYHKEVLDEDFQTLIDNDSQLEFVRETKDGDYKVVFEGTY